MSGYGQAIGYASQAKIASGRPSRRVKRKEMKLSLKQRFRNWLNSDEYEQDIHPTVETSRLDSEGMRLQIYKASGGYVVETRSYDRHKDRNNTSMHIITDSDDLGDSLSKIIMMEALQR